jgi:hypothetical protein
MEAIASGLPNKSVLIVFIRASWVFPLKAIINTKIKRLQKKGLI